jgi:CelD/BcsL family acetyltransferase involved in cellulose biosynthesis
MHSIEITNDLESLLADPLSWDRLSQGVPFRQSAWLQPWWKTFGQDCVATVLTARDDLGQLVGILPLYRRAGSRTLSSLADGNACTDHVSVLARPDHSCDLGREFGLKLASIASDPVHGWDLIDIDGVVEGDEAVASLSMGLKEGDASLTASSRMSTWFKPADANWDEHVKQHGKTQRRRMRRWSEKLSKTLELTKCVAATESEASIILDAIIDMHQRRWTKVGEAGTFSDESFREFMHETVRRFLLQGQLNLIGIRLNGQFISGVVNFIGKDRILYSYSTGYDVDFAEWEPGHLTCIDSLQELYRSNLAGIDFMRGDETYKLRFGAQPRRLFRIRAVAPTMMPRLRHAVWSTGFEVKQWMRRRTGRPEIVVQDPTRIG